MSDKIKIGLLGGDRRMLRCAECLSGRYELAVWGFASVWGGEDEKYLKNSVRCMDFESAVRGSDAVVLPLPVSNDGIRLNCPLSALSSGYDCGDGVRLTEICEKMKKDALLLGGLFPPVIRRYCAEHGIETVDYYDSEELQILNSVPTAEGAVTACLNELERTICGMRAAVAGYGRVGRTLASRLKALGAEVYAVARSKKDLAWARCDGCCPIPLDEYREVPVRCDAVFNTIPSPVFDRALLEKMEKGSVIFELASRSCGVDAQAAGELGVRVVPLPSLPGKISPQSAGEIICSVVGGIIDARFGGEG